jgi:hypothetical protein
MGAFAMSSFDPPAGFTGTWTSPPRVSGDGWDEWACVGGSKTGPWRRFLGDGRVQREAVLVDGNFHGILITRGSGGQILDRAPFVHGTGIYRIFTSDDRLAWEIPLVHGRKHGLVRRLRDGVWHEEEWRNGVCSSPLPPEAPPS